MADDKNVSTQDDNRTAQGTPLISNDDPVWGTGGGAQIIEGSLFNEAGQQVRSEAEEEKPVEDEKVVEETIEEEPAPQINVEDPGEFKPNDYSFDIRVTDPEGKNARSVKIKSIDEFDELLGRTDLKFESAQQLMIAERKAAKMELAQERDKSDYDKQKAAYDKAVEESEQNTATLDTLTSEMLYLEERGDVPRIPDKFRNNWTTAEAKKDPAVKQQTAILNYMAKENTIRRKAGLPVETSLISAFKAYKLDNLEREEEESIKRTGEARKAAGAKVAGNSPAFSVNAPRGIAVGRGGNLNDLTANTW